MSSESVCQVARSWVDVGSFQKRLFLFFMIFTSSVRNILDIHYYYYYYYHYHYHHHRCSPDINNSFPVTRLWPTASHCGCPLSVKNFQYSILSVSLHVTLSKLLTHAFFCINYYTTW
jgi:hypothetical protein